MVHGFAKTPRYVLKDGLHPASPIVLLAATDAELTVVFGFSDKPEYDTFLNARSQALTPYPLVRGYLQNQIDLDVDLLRLIVLDASDPEQEVLDAATFENVLAAFQTDSDSVSVTHQLIRDAASQGYRIQEIANATPEKVVS
ncbi:hypothetical protein Q31b_00160 [Novipirellula aureliae]|uniref:Uncharacterized protein n=2 Tax=Novipirellula aureliae TaxID=2527966 RepID=A0A5C6EBG0_9BACT|nr:hypothetical protein Q31b_00160 [Novipirellula aureliae]